MMKTIYDGAVTVALMLAFSSMEVPCVATDLDNVNDEKANSSLSAKTDQHEGFLGVVVVELHPAIASHLPGIGRMGQGLLVQAVAADSPALKAGVRVHDVLITYADQKLFSPEQLYKLVASDKPGSDVSLGLIREGKPEILTVQLGERPAGMRGPRHHEDVPRWMNRFAPLSPWRGPSSVPRLETNVQSWNDFDSLTIKRLDKDRFQASIAYTDKAGQLKKHEYEGTRDEIRQRIDGDKDLMPHAKLHLLRGLDVHGVGGPFPNLPEEVWLEF